MSSSFVGNKFSAPFIKYWYKSSVGNLQYVDKTQALVQNKIKIIHFDAVPAPEAK
jgi:hypothetical protein